MGTDAVHVSAFTTHDWPAEYSLFAESDQRAPLAPEDLERWAVAAQFDWSPIPGLYFLGLEFQFAAASATIQGLNQDARYLMRHMRPLIKTSQSRTEADLAVSGTGQR